jgi:hypothetical protein
MKSIRHAHTKYHPLTGAPIVPAGYRKNGSPIWPIMGGSGEGGEGGDGGAGGDASGEGGEQGGEAGAGAGGDENGADKGSEPPADETPEAKATRLESEVTRLRRENASSRTGAKQQAADEARKAVVEDIAKALGLKEGDKAPTVEDLTKQLTEQTSKTEETAAVARDTQAELVVWQNATALGVDAGALTDSRAFAAAIKDLDPTSKTFVGDVKKAAQEAAEKNPKLKSTQAAGSSSADHGGTGGGTNSKTPKSLDAAVGGHYGT